MLMNTGFGDKLQFFNESEKWTDVSFRSTLGLEKQLFGAEELGGN
jgi:hypothetical protein